MLRPVFKICPRLSGVQAFVAISALFALMSCGTPESARDHGEKVLRVVPQSDLEILDTVWSTGQTTRNHSSMIYLTLFGMGSQGNIAPQMVDKYDVSPDKKTWTFTLRPRLEFNDGTPVTGEWLRLFSGGRSERIWFDVQAMDWNTWVSRRAKKARLEYFHHHFVPRGVDESQV